MSHKQFTNTLGHDVSDGLVLTATLLKVKWHQDVYVVLKTLWLVDDNFSDGREEHVLLLILRTLDKLEDFVEEELCISN